MNRRLIGIDIRESAVLDSTNSEAKRLAVNSGFDGLVVSALEQTAGRGRLGRGWYCPRGRGVLMSVALFPPEAVCRPVVLTAMAAVSVCEAIYDACRLQATIKWPNDVLIRGKKVCGILVEHDRAAIVGIGLNVSTSAGEFATAQLPNAGSLAMFTGASPDREEVRELIVRHLDRYYGELLAGETGDLLARWRWHLALLGRQVRLTTANRVCRGRLLELDFEHLELASSEGVYRAAPERVLSVAASE